MPSSFRGDEKQSFHTGIPNRPVTQPHKDNFQDKKLKNGCIKTTALPKHWLADFL